MVRRMGLLMLLVAGGFAFTAGDAVACHGGGGSCYSYSCCYYPCCQPCCYYDCDAYRDPYVPGSPGVLWVACSCPHEGHWCWAWIWNDPAGAVKDHWAWVKIKKVYGCYYGDKEGGKKARGAAGAASIAQPATLAITLPSDAKLAIDNQPTSPLGENRRFVSPELQPGKDYLYVLKAEATRDGKLVELTKQVTVRAGEETKVTLDFSSAPAIASAQK